MPTYETTKFLSLPQQVAKNKNDIKTLQDNQADISNLIPNTEKGQPLGVATLDITGKVPAAQLPANPGNFLPVSGGTMEGNINVDGYDLLAANTIEGAQVVINQIDSLSGEVQVQVPLVMNNNKIEGAAKGTASGDILTVENMTDHDTSPFAHADIRNLISAIQGAYIYRGVINENTINVTQINLNARILVLMGRTAILGDVLTDLDRTDWYFDGTSWDNMGQTFVVLASALNDGLMTKEDYTKLFDLYTKAQLDATFEVLANKAIDFSVINDTKYLSIKGVAEMLLNLPITELNNHTLREVFEGGNLWQPPLLLDNLIQVSNTYVENNIGNTTRIYKTGQTISGNLYYLRADIKRSIGGVSYLFIGNTTSTNTTLLANIYTTLRFELTPTATTSYSVYSLVTQGSGEIFEFRNIFMINKTSLGISALTVAQMDYWFNVYQALKVSMANGIFTLFAPKQQEEWITPTLTTATTTYLKYRKDNFGSVIVEGNITVTTAGTNFTLPTGYRPLFAYTVGILTFNTNGTVVSSATGTQTLSVRFTGGA